MTWPSYLSTSPARLETIETWLVVGVFVFTILAGVCGLVATKISNHRSDLRNAQLQEDLKNANARRMALEKQLKERRNIGSENRVSLITRLSTSAWKTTPVTVRAFGNVETWDYARTIANTLRAAGWALTSPDVQQYSGKPFPGVFVFAPDASDLPKAAQELEDILRKSGIYTWSTRDPQVQPGTLWLVVGEKF